MKDLVVIIPMHEFGKENIDLLNKAVNSVPEGIKVILSCKKGVDGRKLKGVNENVTVLAESEGDSFAELVNTAVNNIEEKWFSILEGRCAHWQVRQATGRGLRKNCWPI